MRYLLLLFVLVVLYAAHGSSQSATQNKRRHVNQVVKLGNIDSSTATAGQILANPKLIPADANCRVISFTFTLFPPLCDYIGPYFAKSSNLTDTMKMVIQKNFFGSRCRLFIDNITMVCYNGDTCTGIPILLRPSTR